MTQQPLITHRAAIRTWPGRSTVVGERLARLVQAARPLQACLSVSAHRDPEDLRLWHLGLCWADDQAMAAWLAGPVATLFTELLNERLIMQVDIQPGAAVAEEATWRRAG